MLSIKSCELPTEALLAKYVRGGAYTDCYRTEVSGSVTHEQYVYAFYTTLLFNLERVILSALVSMPSSDDEAKQLAQGSRSQFAAWQVEDRCDNQLLLADYLGRTRSWLMVLPATDKHDARTYLYFGSAITRIKHPKTGKMTLGNAFNLLLGFHKIYSRLLLCSARARLESQLT